MRGQFRIGGVPAQIQEKNSVWKLIFQPVGEVDSQCRFTGSRLPGQRDDLRLLLRVCRSDQFCDLVDMLGTADEAADIRWYLKYRRRRLRPGEGDAWCSRRCERRIGGKHRLVQLLQILTGVDTQFRVEQVTHLAIRVECVGLAPAAVQREHQLRRESFPQRVLGGQRLQFRDDLVLVAESQIEVDTALQRLQPPLGHPGNHIAVQRFGVDVRQHRPPPQCQRPPQDPGFLHRILGVARLGRLGDEILETQQVQALPLDLDAVALRMRHDHSASARGIEAEVLTQSHDIRPQCIACPPGRGFTPQAVDQLIQRHNVVGT